MSQEYLAKLNNNVLLPICTVILIHYFNSSVGFDEIAQLLLSGGVDIASPEGTSLHAAAAGNISIMKIFLEYNSDVIINYGLIVSIINISLLMCSVALTIEA